MPCCCNSPTRSTSSPHALIIFPGSGSTGSAMVTMIPNTSLLVPPVRVELAGNNPFVFADNLPIGERIYAQSEIRKLTPQIFDGPFREAVWSRYGVYVGNCARHPIEFLPGFNDRKNDFGRLWGVAPVAGGFRWRRTTSSNCASAADARESAVLPSRSTSTSWAAGHFSATRSRPEAPLLPRWKAERSVG